MLFRRLFRKKMLFKDYLPNTINNCGYEHRKVAIKYMVNIVYDFKTFQRSATNIRLEVETLNRIKNGTLIPYGEMKIDEVKYLIDNGGTIIDNHLANIVYRINKFENPLDIRIINDEIVWLEDIVENVKKLQK